jgi:hypothetical protein
MAAGNNVLASVGLFETAEGASAAARLAHEWFGKEWGSFLPLPPEVITGEVLAPAAATAQRQTGRRWLADRRKNAGLVGLGTWSETERRAGSDRRGGFLRNGDFAPLFEQQAAS